MKVWELINELEKMDMDREVRFIKTGASGKQVGATSGLSDVINDKVNDECLIVGEY